MKTSIEAVGRVLQENKHKLMQVLCFFQPANPDTTDVLACNKGFSLEALSNLDRLQLNDPAVSALAIDVSNHLNLDAIQAYFLILHFQEAQRACGCTEISVAKVSEFFYQERLHLLKCLELMIQDGAASPFWTVTSSMVDEGLDQQVSSNIQAILRHIGAKQAAGPGHRPRAADPAPTSSCEWNGILQAESDSVAVRELGNLLDIMLAIWDDPTIFCPCGIWLDMAEAFDRDLFSISPDHSTEIGRMTQRAQDLAALLLIQGLHLEDVLQQMYSTETGADGGELFSRPQQDPSGLGLGPGQQSTGPGKRVRRPPRGNPEASWRPSGSAAPQLSGFPPGLAFESTNAFSKEDRARISEMLERLCRNETVHLLQVPTLLGWAAFLVLHDSVSFDIYSDPLETWQLIEKFAGKAWESGGFAALLHLAKADGLRVDYNLASVYKGIQMNLMVASLAAFGISPLSLNPDDLDTILQTTYHLFSDQPQLCSMFWDVNMLAKEPMFHFLNVARDIFPAIPMPLLYLLASVCNGPQNATQVHAYLARLPSLTFRHDREDPDLRIESTEPNGRVFSLVSKPIKEIPMLSIPQGTEGVVVHCLTDQQMTGERNSLKLLRNLSSRVTPGGVHRTVSLSGFNVLGLNSPAQARSFSGGFRSSLDGIHLQLEGAGEGAARQLDFGRAPEQREPQHQPADDHDPSVAPSPFVELQPSTDRRPSREHPPGTPPKVKRSLSILMDIDGEQDGESSDVLVKWSVEPPKGSGVVKVLLELGVLTRSLREASHLAEVLGDLTVILRLLSNMATAESSTGKEMLKYEVQDMSLRSDEKEPSSSTTLPQPIKRRATLLSLVCRVLDELARLQSPSLEAMGLCLSICASLASHAPGEVVQQLMGSELFSCYAPVPLTVDSSKLETSDDIHSRMNRSMCCGLQRFQLLHEQWEVPQKTFPVTQGLLEVLAVVLHKGITSGMVAEAVGWVLPHVLSKHSRWVYAKESQKNVLAELCMRILRRGLQTVASAARHARSNAEVDHRLAFVSALEFFISDALIPIVPNGFPPPATELERSRISSSDLVVIKSQENLAKEVLALVPALDQSQETLERLFFQRASGGAYPAAALSSYLTYSHSDLKMRQLALEATKIFLEVTAGRKEGKKLSYMDLLVSDGIRGIEGNHVLWRNTIVQSTGLVMAGIDAGVCCAALECVRWTVESSQQLMEELLFPTLLEGTRRADVSAPPMLPWRKRSRQPRAKQRAGADAARVSSGAAGPDELSLTELQPLSGISISGGTGADDKPCGPGAGQTVTSTLSVLDCVWDLLQDAPRLLKEKPQPLAAALQLLATLFQSANKSARHREAADIIKHQSGFWTCVASCVPARATQESDNEPEKSQHYAERAALLTMTVELANSSKTPSFFSRNDPSTRDLLDIVRGWEREGWRGRSARVNQMLMERSGTTLHDMAAAIGTMHSCCSPSRGCLCLGIVVMILVIVVVFQRNL